MKTASRLKIVAATASVLRASARPGGPTVGRRIQAVPRLVRATMNGSYVGTTAGRLALMAAAVAYVASPIDLVPEAFLPVLGVADDAVVISWVARALLDETDRFLAWEAGQGIGRVDRPSRSAALVPSVDGQPTTGPRSPAGGRVREAATTYVLESVRRRLER